MPLTASTGKSVALGDVLNGLADDASIAASAAPIPAGIETEVRDTISRRWRIASGDVELQWGAPPNDEGISGRARIRLVGQGQDGWFVVVFRNPGQSGSALRLRAGVRRRVPVAARALGAGRILDDQDLVFEKEIHWGPLPEQPMGTVQPGWRVMRSVEPGDTLAPPLVSPQRLIAIGDMVRLRWRRGVVTVALEGRAMHDAALGERILVNLRGDRGESSGIVTGPGEAALDA